MTGFRMDGETATLSYEFLNYVEAGLKEFKARTDKLTKEFKKEFSQEIPDLASLNSVSNTISNIKALKDHTSPGRAVSTTAQDITLQMCKVGLCISLEIAKEKQEDFKKKYENALPESVLKSVEEYVKRISDMLHETPLKEVDLDPLWETLLKLPAT
jgi:hypothetical protein